MKLTGRHFHPDGIDGPVLCNKNTTTYKVTTLRRVLLTALVLGCDSKAGKVTDITTKARSNIRYSDAAEVTGFECHSTTGLPAPLLINTTVTLITPLFRN